MLTVGSLDVQLRNRSGSKSRTSLFLVYARVVSRVANDLIRLRNNLFLRNSFRETVRLFLARCQPKTLSRDFEGLWLWLVRR